MSKNYSQYQANIWEWSTRFNDATTLNCSNLFENSSTQSHQMTDKKLAVVRYCIAIETPDRPQMDDSSWTGFDDGNSCMVTNDKRNDRPTNQLMARWPPNLIWIQKMQRITLWRCSSPAAVVGLTDPLIDKAFRFPWGMHRRGGSEKAPCSKSWRCPIDFTETSSVMTCLVSGVDVSKSYHLIAILGLPPSLSPTLPRSTRCAEVMANTHPGPRSFRHTLYLLIPRTHTFTLSNAAAEMLQWHYAQLHSTRAAADK